MKLFVFLLSFYIFGLSCITCSDNEECKYQQEDDMELASDHHADHENDTENCPPFCMCACCGQSYNCESFNVVLKVDFPVLLPIISEYKSSLISEVFVSIWKPPQIS